MFDKLKKIPKKSWFVFVIVLMVLLFDIFLVTRIVHYKNISSGDTMKVKQGFEKIEYMQDELNVSEDEMSLDEDIVITE
jgi:lipoprotein signal peptidase